MYLVAFLTLICISGHLGLPINNDRIVYPDELDLDEIVEKAGVLKVDQRSLFDDPEILRFENTTEEFDVNDDEEETKLEYGDFYQGDIILEDDQMELIKTVQKENEDEEEFGMRTGLLWESYRWPKNKKGMVTVPFIIADHYTSSQRNAILSAMGYLEYYTCIEFVGRVHSDDYIYIYSGNGSSSSLGRIGGRQLVSLSKSGCMTRGTIIHELIHALGYDHMQNHADRDKYVQIYWNNIQSKHFHNFEKVSSRKFSNFGTGYDYHSVMHYKPYAFSKNNRVTVLPKNSKFYNIIGQRNCLSRGDQQRINNMYRCYK